METIISNQNIPVVCHTNHKLDVSKEVKKPKVSPRMPSFEEISFKLTQTVIESENNIAYPNLGPFVLSSNSNIPNHLNVSLNISPSKSLKASPNKNQFKHYGFGFSPSKDKNSLTYTISLQEIEQDDRMGYNFYGGGQCEQQMNENFEHDQGFYRNWGRDQNQQTSGQDAFHLNLNPCELNQEESQRDEEELNNDLQNRNLCILKDLNSQSSVENQDDSQGDKAYGFDDQQRIHTEKLKKSVNNCRVNTLNLEKNDIKFISNTQQCQVKKRSALSFNRDYKKDRQESSLSKSKSPIRFSFSKLKKQFNDHEMLGVIHKKRNKVAELIVNRNKISSLSQRPKSSSNFIARQHSKFQDDFINENLQSGLLAQQSKKTINDENKKINAKLNSLVSADNEIKNKFDSQKIIKSFNSPKGIRNRNQNARMRLFKKQKIRFNDEKIIQNVQSSSNRNSLVAQNQFRQIKILGKQVKFQHKNSQKETMNKNKRSQTQRIEVCIKNITSVEIGIVQFNKHGALQRLPKKINTQFIHENNTLNLNKKIKLKQKKHNNCQFFQDSCLRTRKGISQIIKRKQSICKQNTQEQKKITSKISQPKSIFDQNIGVRHLIKLSELLNTKKK